MATSVRLLSLGLGLLLVNGAALADVDAQLTGKTVRQMNGPASEFPLRIEAIAGRVRMGPAEDADRILFTRDPQAFHSEAYAFTTVKGKDKVVDLYAFVRKGKTLDQAGVTANGGVRLLLVPADALFVDRIKATGRKRTIDGAPPVKAEVYTITWRDRSDHTRNSEALLSRDPAAVEFTKALRTMTDSLEGFMAGDNGQAVYNLFSELEPQGLGILSFEDCFSVSFVDTRMQLDRAAFEPKTFGQSRVAQAPEPANQQHGAVAGQIGEKVGNGINQRVDQATDQAIDGAVTRTLDKLFGR